LPGRASYLNHGSHGYLHPPRGAPSYPLRAGLLCPSIAAAMWRLDNFIVIGEVSARELREGPMQFERFRATLTRAYRSRRRAQKDARGLSACAARSRRPA
jgi:hypothetical protein